MASAWAIDGAPGTYSFDTAPVTLTIKGEQYRIPRNYLDRYAPRTEQPNISFEVMLSDFQPISPQNYKCFISQNVCDQIVFAIIFDYTIPAASDQIQGYFYRPDVKTSPGPFGLVHYDNQPLANISDLYGNGLKGGQFYFISCNKEPPPFNLCEYYQRLDSQTSLKYRFKRTQLKNWQRIHTGILSLIASFQAK